MSGLNLNVYHILPRRYFYPSLNTAPFVHHKAMVVSEDTAKRTLCLSAYVGLEEEDIGLLCAIINNPASP